MTVRSDHAFTYDASGVRTLMFASVLTLSVIPASGPNNFSAGTVILPFPVIVMPLVSPARSSPSTEIQPLRSVNFPPQKSSPSLRPALPPPVINPPRMEASASPERLPFVVKVPFRAISQSEYSPESMPSQSTYSTLNVGPAVRPSSPVNVMSSSVAIPLMPPSIFWRKSPVAPSGTFRLSTPIVMLSQQPSEMPMEPPNA